jgi:hypothetical protein
MSGCAAHERPLERYDFFAEPDAQSVCRKIASNFFMSAFASSFRKRSSSARNRVRNAQLLALLPPHPPRASRALIL